MFATAEELVETYNNLSQGWLRRSLLNIGNRNFYYGLGHAQSATPQLLTLDHAKEILASMKSEYLNHDLGKGTRPWDVIDVTKTLDPEQSWIGIEYETGYDDEKDYKNVVNYVWRSTIYSTLDAEGSGDYPVEITFPPVNASDFASKKFIMDRLLARNIKQGIVTADHDPRDMIGTHVNISTPSFRAKPQVRNAVGEIMGISTEEMDRAAQEELFGREPYGSMESCGSHIEGKLFDSTSDPEVWASYKPVMLRLADMIEYLSANYEELHKAHRFNSMTYIANLADILRGKNTPDEATFTEKEDDDDDRWW